MTTKRPGRSMRRRSNRKFRNKHKVLCCKSASIIQRRFRKYLEIRYRNLCPKNYDDCDYINLEKVASIPKSLLVTMDGVGYNAVSLLQWFCLKQIDPLTRKPIGETVPTECASKILAFIKNDRLLLKKKGHFKRRRGYVEAMKKCIRTDR